MSLPGTVTADDEHGDLLAQAEAAIDDGAAPRSGGPNALAASLADVMEEGSDDGADGKEGRDGAAGSATADDGARGGSDEKRAAAHTSNIGGATSAPAAMVGHTSTSSRRLKEPNFVATEAVIAGIAKDPTDRIAAQKYESRGREAHFAKRGSVSARFKSGPEPLPLRPAPWQQAQTMVKKASGQLSQWFQHAERSERAVPVLPLKERLSRKWCSCLPRHRNRRQRALYHWRVLRRAVSNVPAIAALVDASRLPVTCTQRLFAIDQSDPLSRVTTPWMAHPRSRFRSLWDVTMLIFVSLLLFYVPFELGFTYIASIDGTPEAQFWYVMDWMFDVYFVCDIVLSFRTAYVDDGELEQDPSTVARNYLKLWFWLDLLATVPYGRILGVIALAEGTAVTSGTLAAKLPRILRFARLARLMRLLRLFKVRRLLDQLEETGMSAAALMRLAQLFFWLITLAHFLACSWYWVADINDLGPDTWASHNDVFPDDSFSHKYVVSLYWAFVTVTTVGYGDIVPENDAERVFTICAMFLGNGFFAYSVGKLTTMVSQVNAAQEAWTIKQDGLNEFLRYRNLPKRLRRKIRAYYEHFWPRGIYFDERSILNELSFALRKEVAFELNRELILSVPFFKDADENFVAELLLRLRPRHAMAGEFITQIGELGREMFLILKGVVEVSDYSGTHCVNIYEGGFFGEIALLDPGLRRTANVRAKTACELFSLSKKDLDEVLVEFPEFQASLIAIAETRLHKTVADFHEDVEAQRLAAQAEVAHSLFSARVGAKSGSSLHSARELTEDEMAHASGLEAALAPGARARRRHMSRVDGSAASLPVNGDSPHVPESGATAGATVGTEFISRPSALGAGFQRATALLESKLEVDTSPTEQGPNSGGVSPMGAVPSGRSPKHTGGESPMSAVGASGAHGMVVSPRVLNSLTALERRVVGMETSFRSVVGTISTLTTAVQTLTREVRASNRPHSARSLTRDVDESELTRL